MKGQKMMDLPNLKQEGNKIKRRNLMLSYTDKLQEIGIEALEESKEDIKKAIKAAQIEIINKSPQYVEKFISMF